MKFPNWNGMNITKVKEVEYRSQCKAVVVYVPANEMDMWKRRGTRVVNELVKRLATCVFILGDYTIIRPTPRGRVDRRPRSRSLTSVQAKVLENLVFPSIIIARRVVYRDDGSRLEKVALANTQNSDPDRLLAMRKVFKKITRKQIDFFDLPQ